MFAHSSSRPAISNTKENSSDIHLSYFLWQELGDGNITFSDELDFELAELDVIYEDSGINEK
jgi:hypothetical protein